ncbi:unnamed protein product [Arabidopsis halleri]
MAIYNCIFCRNLRRGSCLLKCLSFLCLTMNVTSSDGATTFSSSSIGNFLSPGLSCSVSRKGNEDGESCNTSKGKLFQTGQIWSFYSGNDDLPLYYGRIHKITVTQVFEEEAEIKMCVHLLKANPFPENVIQWEDKNMPVGCGTFSVTKCFRKFTTDNVSLQIVPPTSMDGNEYTILPKIGDVWAIYRSWTCHNEFKDIGSCTYDIVKVLDDTSDYKVLALEPALLSNEEEDKKTFFRAAESRHPDCDDEDGSEVIFTIPMSKMLRFSHQIPASRVTKKIDGELRELFEVDPRALPTNVRVSRPLSKGKVREG